MFEVLDCWYLVEQSQAIRQWPIPAKFDQAQEAGLFYVYASLPTSWSTTYKVAWTQLLEADQNIELTFWPKSHNFADSGRGNARIKLDNKTLLTWRGKVMAMPHNSNPGADFNFCMIVRRPQMNDNKWKNWKDPELSAMRCKMDVFETSSLSQWTIQGNLSQATAIDPCHQEAHSCCSPSLRIRP